MSQNILCLDTGTTSGYAVYLANGQEFSGTAMFKTKAEQSNGVKFLHFKNWLKVTLNHYEIGVVFYEEPRRHLGVKAAHSFGGFQGVIQSCCTELDVEYQGVEVSTIKKAVGASKGKGKQPIIDAVKALGYAPEDDNEADAIAIREYVKQDWGLVR